MKRSKARCHNFKAGLVQKRKGYEKKAGPQSTDERTGGDGKGKKSEDTYKILGGKPQGWNSLNTLGV